MGFIERLERNIAGLEKKIEKERMKIEQLQEKCKSKEITEADFSVKKKQIDGKIHSMNSGIRVLQGGIESEKGKEGYHVEKLKPMQNLKTCPQCGATNKPVSIFCGECGVKFEEDAITKCCPECSTFNKLKNKFCEKCGTILGD